MSVANFKIDIVSANYSIEADHIDELDLDVVSGNGTITTHNAKDIEMDTVSGNISLDIANSSLLNKIDIDSVSGNTDLYLDGNRGYTLDFDTVSGKFTKDFVDGTDTSLNRFMINFDSVSGDLHIHKKQ